MTLEDGPTYDPLSRKSGGGPGGGVFDRVAAHGTKEMTRRQIRQRRSSLWFGGGARWRRSGGRACLTSRSASSGPPSRSRRAMPACRRSGERHRLSPALPLASRRRHCPLPCVSPAVAVKTPPLPRVSTAVVDKTPPLPRGDTAFPCCSAAFPCGSTALPPHFIVIPLPHVSASAAKSAPLPRGAQAGGVRVLVDGLVVPGVVAGGEYSTVHTANMDVFRNNPPMMIIIINVYLTHAVH